MNLNEIRFEVDLKDGMLNIETFEKEVFEKRFSLQCECLKKDLLQKTNKPLKLFI